MTLEERIERLERLWEADHHTIEMLSIYIPRLADIIERYLKISSEYRTEARANLTGIRSYMKILNSEIQEHFKVHNKSSRTKRTLKYK